MKTERKHCKRCRQLFERKGREIVCPTCRNRMRMLEDMSAEKRFLIYKEMSVVKFVKALDAFNKKHKTNYSYGQAADALREGMISKKDFFAG